MKVWWCGYSGVAWIEGKSPGDGVGCRPYWITERGNDYQHDHVTKYGCGEMQLVPADALVIQTANGAWPTLLVMELADLLAYTRYDDDPVQYHEARQFLDDLAAANV